MEDRRSFKGKLVASYKRNKQQAQKENKKHFTKSKVFQFPPPDKVNMTKFFYFPKFIGFGGFKKLSKSALAIYPVICSKADFAVYSWFHLSQEDISIMSGVNRRMVGKAIHELMLGNYTLHTLTADGEDIVVPLLEFKKHTEGTKHFYMYNVGFIRKEMIDKWKGQFFIFHTCIIDSGIWAELSARAKALYLAIRSTAKFDALEYAMQNDIDYAEISNLYDELYRDREWDLCEKSLGELCRMVNIERSNIKSVILQLEEHKLIETMTDSTIKVYLKPNIYNTTLK